MIMLEQLLVRKGGWFNLRKLKHGMVGVGFRVLKPTYTHSKFLILNSQFLSVGFRVLNPTYTNSKF